MKHNLLPALAFQLTIWYTNDIVEAVCYFEGYDSKRFYRTSEK